MEAAGQYEAAAKEAQVLEMYTKAGELRQKDRTYNVIHLDVNALVKQLSDRGQTFTYHCCNCGAPLKVGKDSTEIAKTCPNCGFPLEIIDLAKFIQQRLPA